MNETSIYAVDVWFKEDVHVMGNGQGFTRLVPCKFVIASSEDEAEQIAHDHFTGRGAVIEKTEASLAQSQQLDDYFFPENILRK